MQQQDSGPLWRLLNRLSLKAKLIGALALAGVCLAVLAYVAMGFVLSGQVEDRKAHMADELAQALEVASAESELTPSLAAGIVQLDDVKTIAFVEEQGDGQIVALASDGSPALSAELTAAGSDLRLMLDAGDDAAATPNGSLIRSVSTGTSGGGVGGRSYLVAFDLDEAAMVADLRGQVYRSLATLIAGIIVTIAIAHLLMEFLVTRRVSALGEPAAATGGKAAPPPVSAGSRDEIARARERIDQLAAAESIWASQRSAETAYTLPDGLPGLWLDLNRDLQIIESRVDNGRTAPLNVGHLSDLLSSDIVEHVAETIGLLNPGDEDEFEFAVGIKSYRALIVGTQRGATLEIAESATGVHSIDAPSVEAAQILAALLEELPFGVMDADANGTLRYANLNAYNRSDKDVVGRKLTEIVPSSVAGTAIQALRDARNTLQHQSFVIPPDTFRERPRIRTHVVPVEEGNDLSFFLLALEETPDHASKVESDKVAALEEQLWDLELQIAELEGQLAERPVNEHPAANQTTDLAEEVASPMQRLLDALVAFKESEELAASASGTGELQAAVLGVASVLDRKLGTELVDQSRALEPQPESRFHLATLLDELAIAAGEEERGPGSRISAFVQPSLPKWLYGHEQEARAAVLQMIHYAQLVASDRPLILAAIQDANAGRSVLVRFEVQIPPPMLSDDDIAVLRGCIGGDLPDDDVPSSVRLAIEASQAASFEALDLELVTINDEALAIRCSSSFEIAEDLESEHAWVRGLRTLIIQPRDANDNGIQTALDAFGIIGYAVADEESLTTALSLAEEYSNPYRFVLADVDTPRLEAFAHRLFDGDAPVVLVGKRSEAAMVGAISAGYEGYLPKPVRQVDLLEVILSTVEPPEDTSSDLRRASAA